MAARKPQRRSDKLRQERALKRAKARLSARSSPRRFKS